MQTSLDQLIHDIAQTSDVPASLLQAMLEMEREVLHLKTRRGLVPRLQEALQKEAEKDT